MTRREREAIGRRLMGQRSHVLKWLRAYGVSEREAEDAAQDVFAAAFAHWHEYQPDRDLGGWLYGFIRRVASTWRRTRKRKPLVLMEAPPERTFTLDGPIEARSELRALPEHLRALFEGMAEDGFTAAAGARALGVDPDIVRVRLVELRRGLPVLPLPAGHTLRHEDGCPCWRCAEQRGEDDGIANFRPRQADPTACPHPDDAAMPLSGDDWICGYCGADVDAPPGVNRFVRVYELAAIEPHKPRSKK